MTSTAINKTSLLAAGLGTLLALSAVWGADGVELQPGRIEGSVTFTGNTVTETKTGSFISAVSADGAHTGSTSILAPTNNYSLTVEGDNHYLVAMETSFDHSNQVQICNPTCSPAGTQAASTSRIGVRRDQTPIFVPIYDANSPNAAPNDYNHFTERIIAEITITGLTAGKGLKNVMLDSSATNGSETHTSRTTVGYDAAIVAQSKIRFPVIMNGQVTITGTVGLDVNGHYILRQLSPRLADVSSGPATVDWTIDVSNIGSGGSVNVQAELDNKGLFGNTDVNYHEVRLSATSLVPYSGVLTWFAGTTYTHVFSSIIQNSYKVTVSSQFHSPFGYLKHPISAANQVTVANGSTVPYSYNVNFNRISGRLDVEGFYNNGTISNANVLVTGKSQSMTSGGSALDSVDPLGNFNLIVTDGEWRVYRYDMRYDDSTTMSTLDGVFAADWINLINGATLSDNNISVKTVAHELIFNVIEPPGQPQQLISRPTIQGEAWYQNQDQTAYIKRVEIFSTSTDQNVNQATVRLMAEPGIYSIMAAAEVNGSYTSFGSPTIAIEEPTQILDCNSTDLDPTNDCATEVLNCNGSTDATASGCVSITFETVDGDNGLLSVVEFPSGPDLPGGFKLAYPASTGTDPVNHFFYVSSTVDYAGLIEVCLTVDTSLLPPGKTIYDVTLGHYDPTANEGAGGWDEPISTVNGNQICTKVTNFSPFALLIEDPDAPAPPTSNTPPSADAGDDQYHSCLLPNEVRPVTLDGTGSQDADGDSLVYAWSLAGSPLATGVAATVALGAGSYAITLVVSDAHESSLPDSVTITLTEDTVPPAISILGQDPLTIECGSSYSDPGATATDVCSGDLTAHIQMVSNVDTSAPGAYQVTYRVADAAGLSATATRGVVVEDTAAPVVTVEPTITLWPPNHQYETLHLSDCAVVEEPVCGSALDIDSAGHIVSIYSDEPDDMPGSGDGSTTNDIVIMDDSTFMLRRERQGSGNGRVYGVTFEVTNASGTSSGTQTCYFAVPQCQGSCPGNPAVDDGPAVQIDPNSTVSRLHHKQVHVMRPFIWGKGYKR